jgi:hypothetical protein
VQYPSIHPTGCKSSPKGTLGHETTNNVDEAINYDPTDHKRAGGAIYSSFE